MENEICTETLNRLLGLYRDDAEMIEIIVGALDAFEKYHHSIYKMEIRRKLYAAGAMDAETYRAVIPELDRMRTGCHNALLSEIRLLNRLAAQNGLPPFYPGEVSEEKPIRTWVADAALAFVRQVIVDRVTGGR